VPEQRVGIVLPPGAGAFIANLAVLAAGKTPVNLNFTTSRSGLEASFKLGGIVTIISAEAMRAKLPNFPWLERTLDLKAEIAACGGKRAMVPWLVAAWVLPNQWCADLLGLPKVGDRAEAGLLFTSGSSGEPKGVVLSHRNILANCAQISSLSILPETCRLLGCLPVFHSFGFTVTLWYPMLRGCDVVTVPSPLDTRKIIEAIRDEKATTLIGAPTFIRPIIKKAQPGELRSLDLVVTGAEKLTDDLVRGFLERFHIDIMQGYGLTETTPAANINQPHPPVVVSTNEPQLGKRPGSVGRMMPGMAARIVDPETWAELPMTETGMVLFRGANVFGGYLDDPQKTKAAFRDGWFVTGDLGRFDEEGFLFIEGRLSRFSKIGAEMVPHGTIEQKLVEVFDLDQNEAYVLVVMGVPDPAKGESLVVLTTLELNPSDVREKLLAAGFAALWVPRLVHRVEKIPVLGTGKLDLKECKRLALEAVA
jgi:acyl-[acyl-carrier-protein]-phospholipid O-acyltransferase/long-chain-fatty-acid--[acyl-carrier-protein] ligase